MGPQEYFEVHACYNHMGTGEGGQTPQIDSRQRVTDEGKLEEFPA